MYNKQYTVNKSQIYKCIYNRITLLRFMLDTKYYKFSNELKGINFTSN